jgi:hypothetical protein
LLNGVPTPISVASQLTASSSNLTPSSVVHQALSQAKTELQQELAKKPGRIGTGNESVIFGNDDCTASGEYSTALGFYTTASGNSSVAFGLNTTASGIGSFSAGYKTTALNHQFALGHYNSTNIWEGEGTASGTNGTAFIIGNGNAVTSSNAFYVTYNGYAFAQGGNSTIGADYAEYFEWSDSNPNSEDRRGYFVTLDGDKIKIAKPNDYVLGVVSGHPAIIGNSDSEWRDKFLTDEFGAFITEEYEYEEDGVIKRGTTYKVNPNYDSTLPYIQRKNRPEWDAVGMVGVLSVRDDGTCQVNGYCKVAEDGIATAAYERTFDTYRVIKRVNNHIVKIVLK